MIPNQNLASVLAYKYPHLVNGEDYECSQTTEEEGPKIVNWKALEKEPTVKEVMAFEQEWKDYVKANAYKKAREKAYPSIEDQLDALYWDLVNRTTTWKDSITKVKTDHPKVI